MVSNNKDFVPAVYQPESFTNTQVQTFMVKASVGSFGEKLQATSFRS